MSNMAKQKGKRGENAAIELLQPIVDNIYAIHNRRPPIISRNSTSWKQGKFDVIGLHWLALEIKNVEADNNHNLDKWWQQAKEQAIDGRTPVLMYKKAHKPFRVRMKGNIGTLCTLVDVSVDSFLVYFAYRLRKELYSELAAMNPGMLHD